MITTSVDPPSDDKRWRIVNATMRRHGFASHALIETLHAVQEAFGFLDQDALNYVSACLRVPPSKTYGVATFYHFFKLKPGGLHNCVVCMGTACYIKGGREVLDAVSKTYNISDGETTPDKNLSLVIARCIGSCGLAPATVIDGVVMPKMTPEKALEQIKKLDEHGS